MLQSRVPLGEQVVLVGGILIDGICVGVDVIGGGVVLGLIDGIFVGCLDVVGGGVVLVGGGDTAVLVGDGVGASVRKQKLNPPAKTLQYKPSQQGIGLKLQCRVSGGKQARFVGATVGTTIVVGFDVVGGGGTRVVGAGVGASVRRHPLNPPAKTLQYKPSQQGILGLRLQ